MALRLSHRITLRLNATMKRPQSSVPKTASPNSGANSQPWARLSVSALSPDVNTATLVIMPKSVRLANELIGWSASGGTATSNRVIPAA